MAIGHGVIDSCTFHTRSRGINSRRSSRFGASGPRLGLRKVPVRSHHEVSRLAGRDTTAGQPVHQMSAMDACHHAFHAGLLCPKAGEPHSLREVLSFERLVGAGRSRPIGIIAYYHIISIRRPPRGSWPKEAAMHS